VGSAGEKPIETLNEAVEFVRKFNGER
jgi:hypothetical protein